MADEGTIETRQQETTDSEGIVNLSKVCSLWLEAINLASKEEKDWREAAKKSEETYAMEGENKQKFNILYSNIETQSPAIFNSSPVPDVRRRFSDDDADAKAVAQVIERCISYAIDTTSFDNAIKSTVIDGILPGRGIDRVQYMPYMGSPDPLTGQPGIVFQKVFLQHVAWDDYRRGPATSRDVLPWEAFRHRMTREQLVALNPMIGPQIKLDCNIDGYNPDDNAKFPKDIFQRAFVWEIWDKEAKEVLFIADSYKQEPIFKGPPPVNFENFFCTPEPFQAIFRSNSLIPIEPYRFYKDLASELDETTKRLSKLIKVMKWRGVRAKALGDAFDKIKDLDDGQLAPAENAMDIMQNQGGMDKAIWLMPIEKLISVIKELSEQRERTKQAIYEITGIADIMRGASNANETLGAQQIKTQWGTLRVQDTQKAIQTYISGVFNLMAEVISEKFTPDVIRLMTGIVLTPEQMALLKNDVLRQYRIDIETDSTIRADLNRSQQNISQFITGLSQFFTAVGPAVQQGAMPPEVAIEMIVSFSRPFKLGRQVEDALDQWKQKLMTMQQQAVQPTNVMPPGMPQQTPVQQPIQAQ